MITSSDLRMKDNRIKICHVQLLPIMSGVQRAMLEVLKKLDRERYDITVICKEQGELTTTLAEQGIPWRVFPELVRPINPYRDLLAFGRLFRFFKEQRFDIVHTHSSKTGFIGRVAAHLAGVPIIFHTMHGLPFHEFSHPFKIALYSCAEKLAGLASDCVIFVNYEERELVLRKKILPVPKAVTIYNGIDLNQIHQMNHPDQRKSFRKQWQIDEDNFIVGYVGRLWEQKDPATLKSIIFKCVDLPVRFLVVGDGPYKSEFDAEFAHNQQVIMTGWLEHPMMMYPAIDVLILPSLWEGLPMTLIEAMAFGKPLIASNIKGNRECVGDGENGFLCPPRNPLAFHHAIGRLANDDMLYKRMHQKCLDKAAQLFDAEKNSQKLIELYEEQIARWHKSSKRLARLLQ